MTMKVTLSERILKIRSRFTRREIAVFTCFYRAAFFLLTHIELKAFSQLKALISAKVGKKKCSKRTNKKKCYFFADLHVPK